MPIALKIDFVSDVSCPWCIIGLRGLEQALERTADLVEADIHFQPFELNPMMPKEGENSAEHILRKYGRTEEQSQDVRAMIRDRAAEVGFAINSGPDSRIYNTFDAHRLLHWAGIEDGARQQALKHALFEAYFTDQRDPSDPDVLLAAAAKAGLDRAGAAAVIASDRYAEEVREAEHLWQRRGVSSVPAIIVNDRWLISGGQPPDAFEQAIRSIAAELAPA
ncbi:DsbA family oxidoreductase [Rhizorhabdus dicambivorans]|uniref:DsbA family oxidoreductase n=1 Tax=Rhizorhabdus dicambivorans TaxID=1850238 RepID=A0A2A4FQI1_9SPHN|nr:DsbA family oxidoreductase [Rhizorhabdus dicambivorans]ATE63784.1 DsbA family oxidoreductase [Rhizorhabdus dicambivorans]PCE40427.1 DsbA family oxidoreductase [Rhizorhabdus dicambivorans]